MDRLFLVFDNIRPLSPALRVYIERSVIRKVIKKGEIILREGEIAKNIYFIEEGIVRSLRHKKGNERTSWIMKEGDLFVSVGSFFYRIPASETIEALKDCVVYYISFEQLEKAYEDYPEFEHHGRKLITYYYHLSEKRNEMREWLAYDRFEFLMAHQPELIGRVPQKILASYLGMEPETFSAQKSKFANKNKKKNKKKISRMANRDQKKFKKSK